ncbi:MAG: outer membrane protein transport protein [Bacteroidetes bacterium]|nr:outer membrane protein transport protein [Bacteroidota bacterium]
MNYKQLASIGAFVWMSSATVPLLAQNEIDILRYSFQESLGSTRTMAMGGAFGALGADLACLSGNPAGIGLYRRGDAGWTTGFASKKAKVNLNGQFGNANQLTGSSTNFGIALSYPSVNPDWPVTTLAITTTRKANFNERIEIEDATLDASLLDVFLAEAMGTVPPDLYDRAPFTSSLAWETYLLDPHPNNNPTAYISAIPSGGVWAGKTIERSGRLNETNIGLGSGLNERLYLGASIGIISSTFDETAIHHERPRIDSLQLNEWEFQERLSVEGSGLNFKLGVNLAATNWLRLGLAYHTRSRITFTDEYSTTIRSAFKSGENYDYNSPFNRLEYVIYTPSRLLTSAAFIMGKYGIVTADYERVDYGSGTLNASALSGPNAYDFETENEAARELYGMSHAARVGVEFRIQRDWRLRAGAGMETSPFTPAANISVDANRYTGSMGWAYRTEKWYGAMTYRRSWYERDIYLFSPELINAGRLQKTHGMVVATVGFRM